MSQLNSSFRWTVAGPAPRWYGIGNAPLHSSGAIGPPTFLKSGRASEYEIGRTGILVSVGASLIASRFASSVAPTPGVSGSPGNTGMSATEPLWTPFSFRHGPLG